MNLISHAVNCIDGECNGEEVCLGGFVCCFGGEL